jgi:hypothetical protein
MDHLLNRSTHSLPPGLPWWMGVLPWAAFGVTQEFSPLLAAPLALTVFVLLYWRRRLTLPPLDAGIGAYFLIYSIISLTGLAQILPPRILFALCPAVLGATAILSLLLGQPFTLAYASRYAPEHIRRRPSFFMGNQIITLLWAVGFAMAAIEISVMHGEWKPAQAGLILISVLGATAAISAVIGWWFHIRESRITV